MNNHYVSLNESGMNPRIGGKIRAENNYFEDSKDVLGTFYTNDMGYWQVSGNIFDNITWTSSGNKNYPAGPNPSSTTSISIPYSYSLDNASCVPSIIAATAGANKGLAVSDGDCSTTTPPDNGGGNGGGGNGDGSGTGTNLALSAAADGSSKASGTSYGNVIDGDTSSYWSPNGSTGTINVKNLNATVNAVRIVSASGYENAITNWALVNYDTGVTLATGGAVPNVISFSDTTVNKISFVIQSSSTQPRVAEFEVYNGYSSGGGRSGGSGNNGTVNGRYWISPVHSDKAVDVNGCCLLYTSDAADE